MRPQSPIPKPDKDVKEKKTTDQYHYEQLYANKLDNLEEMDKLLETCNLPGLNHEEKKSLNKLITNKGLKQESKISQHTKAQDQMASQANSIKHLEKS